MEHFHLKIPHVLRRQYKCKLNNGLKTEEFNLFTHVFHHRDLMDYLLGYIDQRPSVNGNFGTSQGIYAADVNKGKFSGGNVPYEERYYNNLIQFKNGTGLTFSTAGYGCFSVPSILKNGDYYQLFV